MKPVLFVTGHVPFDRVGAFARLHELERVEFALFGGRTQHGGMWHDDTAARGTQHGGMWHDDTAARGTQHGVLHPPEDVGAARGSGGRAFEEQLPFPHRRVRQRELGALAACGRYRAVVVSTGGRIALPAAWAGARRGRAPLILWSALWAHPRTAAHAFSYLALRRLYRSAEAVVVYGPHVEAYVRARGARNVHVAPQSVDNDFWGAPNVGPRGGGDVEGAFDADPPFARRWRSETSVKFLFAGRPVREKGLGVLIEAWSDSGLHAPSAALVLVGVGSVPPWIPAGGAVRRGSGQLATREARAAMPHNTLCLDPVPPTQLRSLYAAADVLVVPSISTRTFREPWGLVVNEAMNRKLPVIASDAVGAVAGGLVRDEHNGVVVPAGDARALADAIRRLTADASLRARLGAAGAHDVQAYTHDAWAQGFSRALHSLGLSRALGDRNPCGSPGARDFSRGEHW